MSDILDQLQNYRAHFDRAIGEAESPDIRILETDDEGDVIVVELATRESETTEPDAPRRLRWLAAAVAAAVLLIVGAVVVLDDDDDTVVTEPVGVDQDPAAVLEAYVEAYNAKNLPGVMEFFDESSIILGSALGSAESLDEIGSLHRREWESASRDDAIVISNVDVSGTTVTWDDVFTTSSEGSFCGTGNRAEVQNGIFVRVEYGETVDCPTGPVDPEAQAAAVAVIEGYIEAYNNHDVDGMMTFFDESSLVLNHFFAPRAEGLDEIRRLWVNDLSAAADSNAYVISNIEVMDNTVSWEHVWTDQDGQDFCSRRHEAIVENGIFVEWRVPFAAPCV